jgi:hypothetical protein
MIHPDTELRYVNDVIGFGVFATRPLPRGTISWVRDDLDQVLSPDRVARLREPYREILRKYGYTDGHGDTVLCWDHARFMNHCCEATCLSPGYGFEILIRDVEAGEELTDDYGTLNLEASFPCACEHPQCRGIVRPDDSSFKADRWDELLRGAFPAIRQVAQPMWALIKEKDEVLLAASDVSRMRSCRLHHLPHDFVHPMIWNTGLPIESEAARGNGHSGNLRAVS